MNYKRMITHSRKNIHDHMTLLIEAQKTIESSEDLESVEAKIHFLESVFPDHIFMLCNFKSDHPPYASSNINNLIEYATSKSFPSFEHCFNLIHPEDVKSVGLIYQKLQNYSQNLNYDDFFNLRFALHYRFLNSSRNYIHLRDEKLAMKDKNGNGLHFTLLRDVTETSPFSAPNLTIFKFGKEGYEKLEEFMPIQKSALITKREGEVLKLIKSGLNSKEIASQLNISPHTVKNHRSNLFEKTKARNVIELINYNHNEESMIDLKFTSEDSAI